MTKNIKITIDKNAQMPLYTEYTSVDDPAYPFPRLIPVEHIVSTKTALVYNEILKRFQANSFGDIDLRMKDGSDIIHISPYRELGSAPVLDNIEWFHVSCHVNWSGSEDLVEVAAFVAGYTKVLADNAEEEQKLNTFYEKHIKGNEGFLQHANEVAIRIHNENMEPDSPDFEEFCKHRLCIDPEKVREFCQIAENFQTYSDWHKDIHGFRPR